MSNTKRKSLKNDKMILYNSGKEYMQDYIHLFKTIILCYLHIFSIRFSYSDYNSQVSIHEIIQHSGFQKKKLIDSWLVKYDFPPTDVIMSEIATTQAIIDLKSRNSVNHSKSITLPFDHIKNTFNLSIEEFYLFIAVSLPQIDYETTRFYQYAYGHPVTSFPVSFYVDLLSILDISEKNIFSSLQQDSIFSKYGILQIIPSNFESSNWFSVLHAKLMVNPIFINFILGVEQNNSQSVNISFSNIGIDYCYEQLKPFMKTITSSKIILYGQSGDGREETIEKLASDNNHNISTFDLSSLSGLSENIIINSIQDIFSNSLLYNSFILIKSNGLKMLFSEKQFRVKASLKGLMQTHNKSIFVLWDDGSSCPNELFGAFSEIRIPLPNKSDQKRIWELELSDYLSGDEVSYTVDSLSTSYCMTHGEIHDLVEKCIQQNPEAKINLNLILSTIKNTRDFGLDGLAMLTPTTLGMNDIVLNENQISSMKEMLAYARHSDIVFEDWGFSKLSHSTGICALFYGPPGTGKTLSAGVIAHELKKAMYVVDLSRVIDKYVGETEKQLAKIFEYAQKSQSVLLFDEADSLFAKRTGVKSSNDRYANLEVNYLLQKIESFRGICILTTNNVDQLDEALARRIPFKISFNLPDEVQREKLWRILIPPKAPVSDIDFNALSEAFEMSGGHIRNSVLRACIRASSECIPISTTLLWDAAETEYREMGHAITFNSYERFTDHSDYC